MDQTESGGVQAATLPLHRPIIGNIARAPEATALSTQAS